MKNPFMETAANRDYSKSWQQPGTFPYLIQLPKEKIEPRAYDVRENYIRCIKGEHPYWMPCYGYESNTIWPDAIEEHPIPEVDGYDWWGVYWTMVESAGGMITKTGTRVINDFENWEKEVPWPELDLVDFASDGKKIAKNLDPDRPHIYECVEGLTERLHEMMPFDEYLLTFYEYPEELERFLQKMTDYKIESCGKIFENYGRVDGVLYHDDWGTQRAGFFSNEMFREQIMPATRRFTDYVKSQGKFLELHSCGNNIQYVPEMIELGFDMWTPQENCNDPEALYEQYGDKMTFAFGLNTRNEKDEAGIRDAVRAYVEKYGAKGRWMVRIMDTPERSRIARDELYRYSLDYYNKLYGRK